MKKAAGKKLRNSQWQSSNLKYHVYEEKGRNKKQLFFEENPKMATAWSEEQNSHCLVRIWKTGVGNLEHKKQLLSEKLQN